MKFYSEAAMERAMKIQEVILRAIGKRISWWQAAEIIGISESNVGVRINRARKKLTDLCNEGDDQ